MHKIVTGLLLILFIGSIIYIGYKMRNKSALADTPFASINETIKGSVLTNMNELSIDSLKSKSYPGSVAESVVFTLPEMDM